MDIVMPLIVCKMDKKLIESFVFSIISFLGLGMGLISLLIFLIRGKTDFFNLAIPIIMILFGLFAIVNLFSEK